MTIPTEPIGSIPRPPELIQAVREAQQVLAVAVSIIPACCSPDWRRPGSNEEGEDCPHRPPAVR